MNRYFVIIGGLSLACVAAMYFFWEDTGPLPQNKAKIPPKPAAGQITNSRPELAAPPPAGAGQIADPAVTNRKAESGPSTAQAAARPSSLPHQPEAEVEEARAKIVEAIQAAAVSYDARELPRIRPHLSHPDPLVREAAVNGIITLGDAAGAPLLREAAQRTPSPEEAVYLLKMADWLELPSPPIELIKARIKERQAKLRNTPPPPAP